MSNKAARQPLARRDLETKIVALAWQDAEFRSKFVTDPKGQFEERLGTRLPASLKITVHEEDEHHLHFVIPMKRKATLDELSDEELERVAGGTDILMMVTVTIVTAVITGIGVAASLGQSKGGW
jgi:hypothetical protein